MAGKTIIEIWRGQDKQWYFRTVSRNHQIGDVSEGYTRKSSAVRGARRWHPGLEIRFL